MPIRRVLLALALALAVASSLGASAAGAQAQSGVTVDPGSPSGKEYAIPLDSARRDAAPGTPDRSGGAGDDTSAPLFGAGVGDPASTTGGTQPKSATPSQGQPKSRTAKRAAAGQPRRSADAVAATARRAAVSVPEGGSGSTLAIAAVALSVLLLGGVIGSIARRRDG